MRDFEVLCGRQPQVIVGSEVEPGIVLKLGCFELVIGVGESRLGSERQASMDWLDSKRRRQ